MAISKYENQDLIGKYVIKDGCMIFPSLIVVGKVTENHDKSVSVMKKVNLNRKDEDDIEIVKLRKKQILLVADTLEDALKIKEFSKAQISKYYDGLKEMQKNYDDVLNGKI